jgi:two-component system KDP operon response regulator KdpE
MPTNHRILVVDDEPQYVWAIQTNLEARGYEVYTAADGAAALELLVERAVDLIILDVRMPGVDGFEVCERLRTFSAVPVIMLTALAESEDKVKGLDLGADDYVTKPFNVPELLSRVRAALRRAELERQRDPAPVFRAGQLEVDFVQQQVRVGGQAVHLTPTEYRLLCELVWQADKVLVFDYLLGKVWGMGYEGQDQLVRQAVHRLRAKIEPRPRDSQYIETRVGLGYVFVSPDE